MSLQQDLKLILPNDSLRHDRCVLQRSDVGSSSIVSSQPNMGGLIFGVWCRWSEIVFISVYEDIMVDKSH